MEQVGDGMNRYVAEGVVRDMRAGKTVIVASETAYAGEGNFKMVRDAAHEEAGEITSTRNQIRDHRSGGSVLVRSINRQADGSWYGMKADVVYVDYRDRRSLLDWWDRVGRGLRDCEIVTD